MRTIWSILSRMTSSVRTESAGGLIHFRQPELPVARVLHQIRTVPETTRGMLHATLGYSQPSVTRHVRALLEAGLVEEHQVPPDGERAGRPHVRLAVDAGHVVIWGAHMGLRSTTVALSDGTGRLIRERTLPVPVADLSPAEALGRLAAEMRTLGEGLPGPARVGVAFSAHLDRRGLVSSPVYGWEEVDAAAVLAEELGHPVYVSSGVAAMAGRELSGLPVADGHGGDSTLYFYAREVVSHAWIVNGAVHRPHSGQAPEAFLDLQADNLLLDAWSGQGGHPLGGSTLVRAARNLGLEVNDLPQLIASAETQPRARALLDERARLLTRAILLALDVIDPESLVLAGETFRLDPVGLRGIVEKIRQRRGGPGQLRINLAGPHAIRDAALLAGLHEFWQNPLEPGSPG